MTKDEYLQQKKEAIADINRQQIALMTTAANDLQKTLKQYSKAQRAFMKPNRKPKQQKEKVASIIGKAFALSLQIKNLQIQKHIIASQPYFDNTKFKSGGIASIGE